MSAQQPPVGKSNCCTDGTNRENSLRVSSDTRAPFHTKVINTTVRDATHVLDGLLYHESDLRIEEHFVLG
jgi:Tn3 transposase DDE domain